MCNYTTEHVSEDNLYKPVLSFHHGGSGIKVRLSGLWQVPLPAEPSQGSLPYLLRQVLSGA